MFHEEWEGPVTIKAVEITDPHFPQDKGIQGAFDIVILVEADDGRSDWWRQSMSSRYGTGNYSGTTQFQSTMQTLAKIGLPNSDLTRYKELIGMRTVATVKQAKKEGPQGQVYFNVKYLGGGAYNVDGLSQDEAQARIQAMMANQGGQQAQQFSGQQQQPQQGQQFNGQQQQQGHGFQQPGQ